MSQRISIEDIPEDVLYHVFNPLLLKRELLSCSLLSKKWRSTTFIQAFRSLSLLVKSKQEPNKPRAKINRYVEDLLGDPFFSSIQHIVRRLTLRWAGRPGLASDIEFDFVDFLPSFPALSSLTLRGKVGKRLTASHSHLKGSLRLDELVINGIIRRHFQDHSFNALCDLLSTFGSLKSLVLRNLWQWVESPSRYEPVNWGRWTLPQPNSLVLENFALFQGFQGLFEQTTLLKKVKDFNIMAIGCGSTCGIMMVCTSSLESLSLALGPGLYEVVQEGHLEQRFEHMANCISSLRTLKALVLGIEAQQDLCRHGPPFIQIEAAVAVIRALPPNASLNRIELCFCYGPATFKCDETVVELKRALSHGKGRVEELEATLMQSVQAGRIGHVRVGLYAFGPSVTLCFPQSSLLSSSDYLSTLFPRLFERGVLFPHGC